MKKRAADECVWFDGSLGRSCRRPVRKGQFCQEHYGLNCVGCGRQSVRGCSGSNRDWCGAPICGNCDHFLENHAPLLKFYDGNRCRLRPIPDIQNGNEGYRGEYRLAWSTILRKGVCIEIFATWCPICKTSWGWGTDAKDVLRTRAAMEKYGCPKCMKKRKKK